MTKERELPSLVSVAFDWASRVSVIGMEFAAPSLLGFGIDRGLGTLPVGTVAGAFLGFAIGMLHTLRMARELSAKAPRISRSGPGGGLPTGRQESAGGDENG